MFSTAGIVILFLYVCARVCTPLTLCYENYFRKMIEINPDSVKSYTYVIAE